MRTPKVRMIVETLPDQRMLEAIFQPEIASCFVQIETGSTTSGALSLAVGILLTQPDPVALVLNTDTEDPQAVDEIYYPSRRVLGRAALDNWQLALAIPRLDAWAMIDARIKEAFLGDEKTRRPDRGGYLERAARMQDLVRGQPFDREALRRASAQFRGLLEFLERCKQAPPTLTPATAF